MATMININGSLVSSDKAGLSIQNRGFKFGDSLFETIRVIKGRALFIEDHFSRLSRGMTVLKYDFDAAWNQAYFKKEIQKVIESNNLSKSARIRFSVFRKSKGFYTPVVNEFGFVIESESVEPDKFILNDNGLKLGIFNDYRLNHSQLSPFKTNNCLPFIMAGISAKESEYDELIILNDKDMVCEGISSNVFLFTGNELITPSIESGCTAGIMRKKIMQICSYAGITVIEKEFPISLLNEAEEVFMTNSISGIKWVKAFDKKRYYHRFCEELVVKLNEIT